MTKEEYLLVHLMEECSEVQKACSKALRFGLQSNNNAFDIINELDDIEVLTNEIRTFSILPFTTEWASNTYDRHYQKRIRMYTKLNKSIELGRIGE